MLIIESKYLLTNSFFMGIMGLLNYFLSSTEKTAKEIKLDNDELLRIWKDYLETVPKKKAIIDALHATDKNLNSNLQELKKLLDLELVDISGEERDEAEIIADLEKTGHEEKIKKVQRLKQCLGYAKTKYEHVFGLLQHLHSILQAQMHLVEKLLAGSQDPETLISHIKAQFELEQEVIKQIKKIETFDALFSALVKGEHIIQQMTSREKLLYKRIKKLFTSDVPIKGITSDWAAAVYDAIEDKARESIADVLFPGAGHVYSDFEFVNRPEFIDLVRETIQRLRQKEVSEEMINAFVSLFRAWYNEMPRSY